MMNSFAQDHRRVVLEVVIFNSFAAAIAESTIVSGGEDPAEVLRDLVLNEIEADPSSR